MNIGGNENLVYPVFLIVFLSGVGLQVEVAKKLDDLKFLNWISTSRIAYLPALYFGYHLYGFYGYLVACGILNSLIYFAFLVRIWRHLTYKVVCIYIIIFLMIVATVCSFSLLDSLV